jgi:hypothetical protein
VFTSHTDAIAMAIVIAPRIHWAVWEPEAGAENCLERSGKSQIKKYAAACSINPSSELRSRFDSVARGGRFRSQNVNPNIHQHATSAQNVTRCARVDASKLTVPSSHYKCQAD